MNERLVAQLVLSAESANGRAFITAPCDSVTRAALVDLAMECGLPAELARKANDRDLCTLYAVARKNPLSAAQVAGRIATALGGAVRPETPAQTPSEAGPGVSEADVQALISQAFQPYNETLVHIRDQGDNSAATLARLENDLSAKVEALVSTALAAIKPTELVIKPIDGEPVFLGTVHYKTPAIIKAVSAGLNVYLHGPAGSGKTTVAQKVAEALKLPFHFAAKVESEYLLLGFKDARGETVRTAFREAYEHGGVFLFDEMDASSPGAIVAINAALANGVCPFPDGVIKRHADFYCIAAGNTKLTGADRQYTGRNQMDAASIDRFAFIEFPYDEALELSLASDKLWAQHVQAVRAVIAERGLKWLVTPRATIDGCKSLNAGFSWEEAETMHVFKGLDPDTVDQIKRAIPNPILGAMAA